MNLLAEEDPVACIKGLHGMNITSSSTRPPGELWFEDLSSCKVVKLNP